MSPHLSEYLGMSKRLSLHLLLLLHGQLTLHGCRHLCSLGENNLSRLAHLRLRHDSGNCLRHGLRLGGYKGGRHLYLGRCSSPLLVLDMRLTVGWHWYCLDLRLYSSRERNLSLHLSRGCLNRYWHLCWDLCGCLHYTKDLGLA